MSIRIALSGKMASGKSLVARHLVDNYGFVELAFADRLKVIASEMFDLDTSKKDKRGRHILQQFAHQMREIDPQVWLRYVIKALPRDGDVVVSDVRYLNEYKTLKRLGFVMIRMFMPRDVQERMVAEKYPGVPLILLDDYTETALDDMSWNWTINNGGDVPLVAVYRQVDMLMDNLTGGRHE